MQVRQKRIRQDTPQARIRRPPSATLILGAVAGLAFVLAIGGRLPPMLAWLLAINGGTLAVFGYDKIVAGSARTRVPERVLLALACVGGSPAAILAMLAFRHKTSKTTFVKQFVGVVVLQALAVFVSLAATGG